MAPPHNAAHYDENTMINPVNKTTHVVTVMTRATCGSCARVIEQIRPVVADYNARLEIMDVDADGPGLAMEFGDRVPVILVDDEEIACWEIDNDELIEALT